RATNAVLRANLVCTEILSAAPSLNLKSTCGNSEMESSAHPAVPTQLLMKRKPHVRHFRCFLKAWRPKIKAAPWGCLSADVSWLLWPSAHGRLPGCRGRFVGQQGALLHNHDKGLGSVGDGRALKIDLVSHLWHQPGRECRRE